MVNKTLFQYSECCGKYRIKYIRDLTTGFDNSRADNKPVSIQRSLTVFVLL